MRKEKPPIKVASGLAIAFLILQIIDKALDIVQKLTSR